MTKKITISKERKSGDLVSVAKTIKPIAQQIIGTAGFMEIEVLSNWRDIVGENMSSYTLPQKISFSKNTRKGGCLYLLTLSGAFAMEIQQKEKQILQKINTYFGYEAVEKIRIEQTANINDFLFAKKSIDNVKKNLVSNEEENYITEMTKEIKNASLREVLEKLGRAVLANKDKQEL